jgi:hypothetical protein
VDQLGDVLVTSLLQDDSARQSQVSIKPGGPSTTTVCLRVDHDISGLFPLAHGSDLEAWRIGMASNDTESCSFCQSPRDDESEQGGLVPRQVVFSSWDDVSGLESGTQIGSSGNRFEACFREVADGSMDCVEWRRRGIDELEERERLCWCEGRGGSHG